MEYAEETDVTQTFVDNKVETAMKAVICVGGKIDDSKNAGRKYIHF